MQVRHAGQNAIDREIGEAWEARFQQMATGLGMDCHRPEPPEPWWPHRGLLPDRIVRHDGLREWHELKHKRPTRNGEYGLEGYRFAAYLRLARHTEDPVLYTVHDWQLSGAKSRDEEVPNDIEDWLTIDVLELEGHESRAEKGPTYYGGGAAETTVYYWPADMWEPLAWRWGLEAEDKSEERELREIWWAIVKDDHGRGLPGTRWARAGLGLDDR